MIIVESVAFAAGIAVGYVIAAHQAGRDLDKLKMRMKNDQYLAQNRNRAFNYPLPGTPAPLSFKKPEIDH